MTEVGRFTAELSGSQWEGPWPGYVTGLAVPLHSQFCSTSTRVQFQARKCFTLYVFINQCNVHGNVN